MLVLMDPEPEQVRGVIVSAGKPAPQNHGTVVAIGPRVRADLAAGDRVLWSRWHAEDVEVGGVVHKLMREDEVMAVLSTSMRTKEPVQIICDGCNRSGAGFRVSNTVHLQQGPVSLMTIQPPAGWRTALVRPDISLPGGQQVDANMTAPQLARATDGGVEACLCDRCQKKLAFRPIEQIDAGTAPEEATVLEGGRLLEQVEAPTETIQ